VVTSKTAPAINSVDDLSGKNIYVNAATLAKEELDKLNQHFKQTGKPEIGINAHNLTQFDGRFFTQEQQRPVRDTFDFPRIWFIFSGRLTRPFEYYVAPSFQFDNVNLLDAYLNIHYDDRWPQVKLGPVQDAVHLRILRPWPVQ